MNWILVGLVLMSVSCSTQTTRNNIYSEPDPKKPLVDDKYSLTADRKKMEELRKDIPQEKKTENDELAQSLAYFAEVKKSPSEIRSQFDKALRKKRETMDKDITKERDTFSKAEKKKRDDFLKSQAAAKEQFGKGKHSREERTDFFKEIDAKRSEYFSDERERRGDFESDIRDKRKNFEDYAREKNNEFNQDYRAYLRKYDEMKKEEREKEKSKESSRHHTGGPSNHGSVAPFVSSDVSDLDREVEEARKKAGSSLAPGE